MATNAEKKQALAQKKKLALGQKRNREMIRKRLKSMGKKMHEIETKTGAKIWFYCEFEDKLHIFHKSGSKPPPEEQFLGRTAPTYFEQEAFNEAKGQNKK